MGYALSRAATTANPGMKSPFEMWYGSPPPSGEVWPFLKPAVCRVKITPKSRPKTQDFHSEAGLDVTEAGFPLPPAARVAPAADTADGTEVDAEGTPPASSVSSGRAGFGGDGSSSSSSNTSINSSDGPALKGEMRGH